MNLVARRNRVSHHLTRLRFISGLFNGEYNEAKELKSTPSLGESRDDQTRTGDLAPPRRVRYLLRYIPNSSAKISINRDITKF